MNLRQMVKSWLPDYLPASIVNREPLILAAFWFDFYRQRTAFQTVLAPYRQVFLLAKLGYQYETAERVAELQQELATVRAILPQCAVVFLCDTTSETELFRAAGLEAYWVQQNVFLDERKYRILPQTPKKFDALYIARATPCKRHALAAQIPALAVIGGFLPSEQQHYEWVRRQLPQADWRMAVPASRISHAINQARTGLCLSDVEGAMYVSAEYLLCGVPVVNTPNIGGRDVLFPPEFVLTVPPEPEAVAAAVRELIARRVDPVAVRAAILALMQPHRERYAAVLTELCRRAGNHRQFRFEWDTPHCFHKLGVRTGMWPWERRRYAFRAPR